MKTICFEPVPLKSLLNTLYTGPVLLIFLPSFGQVRVVPYLFCVQHNVQCSHTWYVHQEKLHQSGKISNKKHRFFFLIGAGDSQVFLELLPVVSTLKTG